MIAASENTCRDQLIIENLHLVRLLAANLRRSLSVHTELDDLTHAGTMGLIEAATKYRAEMEVPFAVYAKHRIRGAILDSLRRIDWATRDARKTYKQIHSVSRDLSLKLQRTPTQAEVAEAMGVDEQRWQAMMRDFHTLSAAATQQSSSEYEDSPAREIPANAAHTPDSVYFRTELRAKLDSAMGSLPRRHREVVTLYYERDMTMKEIGGVLGVNESRVSQMHKAALAKMHIYLDGSGIASAAALCA